MTMEENLAVTTEHLTLFLLNARLCCPTNTTPDEAIANSTCAAYWLDTTAAAEARLHTPRTWDVATKGPRGKSLAANVQLLLHTSSGRKIRHRRPRPGRNPTPSRHPHNTMMRNPLDDRRLPMARKRRAELPELPLHRARGTFFPHEIDGVSRGVLSSTMPSCTLLGVIGREISVPRFILS